jgi:hypothetical protein
MRSAGSDGAVHSVDGRSGASRGSSESFSTARAVRQRRALTTAAAKQIRANVP